MPRSSSGKWVARAGATGGGRTYRGRAPVNWYAALVVIVLVGVFSVAFARHEYEAGPVTNTTAPLANGSPWFAAAVFDICGTQEILPSNIVDTSTQSFFTAGDGVIAIAPKSTSDAGANATFGKFVSSYKGLTVTSTEIVLPASATTTSTTTAKTTAATSKTYRSGATCAKGTKDAGKKADIEITYWKSAFAAKSTPVAYTGDPASLPFTDGQLITVGFVPPGTTLPKPNGSVVTALLDIAAGSKSTTTTTTATTPSSTTTTTPSSTTTSTTASSTTTSTSG